MTRSISVLLLATPAAIVSPAAHATVFLSIEQAQQILFPGTPLTPDFRTLTEEQADAIENATDVPVRNRALKLWSAEDGGWFMVDEVVGKHDFIPFALAVDANGAVKGVEILEYRESYGSQVREDAWRAQFTGQKKGAPLTLETDIRNISGATLSCRHVTDGVKRLLTTLAVVTAR